jgi:hypothetical protein
MAEFGTFRSGRGWLIRVVLCIRNRKLLAVEPHTLNLTIEP